METDSEKLKEAGKIFAEALQSFTKQMNGALNNINPEDARKYRDEIKNNSKLIDDKLTEMNIAYKNFNDSMSSL